MPAKSSEPSTTLTRDERDQLARCEANIERNLSSIGAALQTIRDQRLYRGTHDSFDRYCYERWQKSARWAHYQIAAAIFAEEHPELDVTSEGKARALRSGGSAPAASTPAKPTKADRYREQIRALAEMDREALDRPTQQSIAKLAETMAKWEKVNLHSKENRSNKVLRDEYEQRVLVQLAPNAQIAMEQLEENPALAVSRAYVGVLGSIKKGQVRGDTDHPGNFHVGLKKLATSFPHWETFTPETRKELVRMWIAVRDTMPKAFWDDVEKFAPMKKGGRS